MFNADSTLFKKNKGTKKQHRKSVEYGKPFKHLFITSLTSKLSNND